MTRVGKQTISLGLVLFFLAIFSCWTVYDAYGQEWVTVAWDHSGATDLAGFDLRVNKDDSALINVQGADVREWSGTITLRDGNNTLDMRAKDKAGQVSGWSEPCYYDPIPNAPVGVTVTVKVTVVVN